MARYSHERFTCLLCLTQPPCSSEPQSQDEASHGVPGTLSPRTTRRAMGALSPMPRQIPEGWKRQEKIQAQNEQE